MRVLVIPDVHLKPWMFTKAEELMKAGTADRAVCLMDIADDWNRQYNIDLYIQTYDAAIRFAKEFPDTLWCYGNHDLSYLWNRKESGYSPVAPWTVCQKMYELEKALPDRGQLAYLHRIDSVIFSHGGLCELFVKAYAEDVCDDTDAVIKRINSLGSGDMWQDASPIWLRPQHRIVKMYGEDMGITQVVGHTPVSGVRKKDSVISCDVFSTKRDGTPIGTQAFTVIDTKTGKFEEVSGVTKTKGLSPDLLVHPGETLKEVLKDRKLTAEDLSKRTGIPAGIIMDVIRGDRDITPGFAQTMQKELDNIPALFWIRLQRIYDSEKQKLSEQGE